MNEFVEQFLIEARELVEQATADLLALEEDSANREQLDSLFRAVHTLKGSAGIVDFAAMARALHAAEDALSRVRAGAAPVTMDLIGNVLTCLDQVGQWLDQMQAEGEPPANAEGDADVIVTRFSESGAHDAPIPAPTDPAWLDDLLARGEAVVGQARTAVRYAPAPDCFFRGEDPAGVIGGLPELVMLDIDFNGPLGTLDAIDPFTCGLVFYALSNAAADDVEHYLKPHLDQVAIRSLAASPAGDSLPPAARAVLEAQLGLIGEPAEDGRRGRIASAGRVAAHVLRHLSRGADVARIERSEDQNGAALAATIRAIMDDPAKGAPPAPAIAPAAPSPLQSRKPCE